MSKRKKLLNLTRLAGLSLSLPLSILLPVNCVGYGAEPNRADLSGAQSPKYQVDKQYCRQILAKVDGKVRREFYDLKKATTVWPAALAKMRPAIEASKSIQELADNINQALAELHSSHCQFTTVNDDIFYFLHSLMGDFLRQEHHVKTPKINFTGAITGGVNAKFNQIRYILDYSPAQNAGLKIGDQIISVNGHPYIGQLSFAGCAMKVNDLVVRRGEKTVKARLVVPLIENYGEYVQAIRTSVRFESTEHGKIAYIHFWCGGSKAHEQFEEILSGADIHNTAGLILDLRDGYGAAYFDDLDFFYRPAKGYPLFGGRLRKRLSPYSYMFYDKPVVALINGGVRSGKELMAYSLKATGRARLVGEKTAGSVVGGRLFPLDDRTALYLAVSGPDPNGLNLEAVGVTPDVDVPISLVQRGQKDLQLEKAKELLQKTIMERSGP